MYGKWWGTIVELPTRFLLKEKRRRNNGKGAPKENKPSSKKPNESIGMK